MTLGISGCGPAYLKHIPLNHIEIQKSAQTKDLLTEIEQRKIEKPIPIEMQTPDGKEVIGYLVKEHDKLVAKVRQGKEYHEVAKLYFEKLGIQTRLLNSMIDLLQLEQARGDTYYKIFVDTQNQLIKMERQKVIRDALGTIVQIVTTILLVVVLI